jgi:hypothetical protein
MRTSHSTRVSRYPYSSLAIAVLVAIAALAAAPGASATTVTLPAAASIQGVAPFFSDVRVFNTSHEATVTITATYYCFLNNCPASPPQVTFDLAPRDSQAFNDIVAQAFGAPDSAGGIEFTFDGDQDLIIVTSRLYATEPTPTVGMFIPGLAPSQAYQLAALPSIQNGGSGAGFRTNVGAYNPNDTPAVVTFSLLSNHVPVGGAVDRVVPAHSGVQVNNIFGAAGVDGEATDNGVLVVQSNVPVFSYAAVIDNNTQDPYLVIGAQDRAAAAVTATPASGTPTRTRTSGPTVTPRLTMTPSSSASPTPTPNASSSPLLRRVLNESRPAQAPSVAVAGLAFFSPDAGLPEERLLAVLREERPPQGGW